MIKLPNSLRKDKINISFKRQKYVLIGSSSWQFFKTHYEWKMKKMSSMSKIKKMFHTRKIYHNFLICDIKFKDARTHTHSRFKTLENYVNIMFFFAHWVIWLQKFSGIMEIKLSFEYRTSVSPSLKLHEFCYKFITIF